MTRAYEDLTLVRRYVVVFDICSSTAILEGLKQTDHLTEWRNLFIALKKFLIEESAKLGFEVYKFIGDGWMLLFPTDISQSDLTDFMKDLSRTFDSSFDSLVGDLLQRRASPIGLTFGMDARELVRLEMNEQIEYLGRAINVACRLQQATKVLPGNPACRALFSNPSFNSLPRGNGQIQVETVTVPLKNISNGGQYECLQYQVL